MRGRRRPNRRQESFMSARTTLNKIVWIWVAPLAALSALGLALFAYYHAPRQGRHEFRMTAGDAHGTRHQIAQALRGNAHSRGLQLEIEETAGSEAALDRVNAHSLDVALVQGGLRVEDRPDIRQVATLQIEPLHLLVKKELADLVSANMTALDGKKVNLGSVGSGTHSLATEVLAFAGLRPHQPGHAGGYVAMTLGRQQLAAEKDRNQLPDAVFLVSSLPSETARY